MTCQFCEQAKKVPFGEASMGCKACCARMITSVRPNRKQQDVAFAVMERIRRYPFRDGDVPSREEILAYIREQEGACAGQ